MIASMDKTIKQLAIIGSTASGKSHLAVTLAKKTNAFILSLDSLSLYKEIDIVSAKPMLKEREGIRHYGIDVISANEHFDVTLFIKLYQEAYREAQEKNKNLIIVGGTSFYLKSLIEGISPLPTMNTSIIQKVKEALLDLDKAYRMLSSLDPTYMQNIASNDRYRIEKALGILYASAEAPSYYFAKHPPIPIIIGRVPIYRIITDKSILRSRITRRTREMLKNGLIDEVAYLEKYYTRAPNCMKAIGIIETLSYLDGTYDKSMLEDKIITHTARLAKRQKTFNQSQFSEHIALDLESLEKKIVADIENDL